MHTFSYLYTFIWLFLYIYLFFFIHLFILYVYLFIWIFFYFIIFAYQMTKKQIRISLLALNCVHILCLWQWTSWILNLNLKTDRRQWLQHTGLCVCVCTIITPQQTAPCSVSCLMSSVHIVSLYLKLFIYLAVWHQKTSNDFSMSRFTNIF